MTTFPVSLPRAVSPVPQGIALVLGPALLAASTFYWNGEGRLGVTGGTLTALATTIWLYGLIGLVAVIRERLPRYAAVLLPALVVGALGGLSFGFQGFYEGVLGLSKADSLGALAQHQLASEVMLWLPGPVFPLSLVLLAVGLWRSRLAPVWLAGLLAVGAVLFPLGRITRIDAVAHGCDLLLLVPFALLGWTLARTGRRREEPAGQPR
jgi:hypothetical protein